MSDKKNKYDKVAAATSLSKGSTIKGRDIVTKELRDLGGAYVSFLSEKYNLPNLKREIVPLNKESCSDSVGTQSSDVVILQIVVKEPCSEKCTIVSCSFEPNNTYPCTLSVPFARNTMICSSITEVRKTLVSFCEVIGPKLVEFVEKIKGDSGISTQNDLSEASTEIGTNSI